jgi:hypothetical protein
MIRYTQATRPRGSWLAITGFSAFEGNDNAVRYSLISPRLTLVPRLVSTVFDRPLAKIFTA